VDEAATTITLPMTVRARKNIVDCAAMAPENLSPDRTPLRGAGHLAR